MTTLVQENKKDSQVKKGGEFGEVFPGSTRKLDNTGSFSEAGGEAFVECDRRRQTNLDPATQPAVRAFLTLHLLPLIPPRQFWKTAAETDLQSSPFP